MKANWLATPKGRTILLSALFALVLLRFAIVGYGLVLDNTDSNGGDQGAFLLMGLDIRSGAALTDGNRQPLFPLLIAPFAERTWRYYTLAKLISLAAGIASLVAIYGLGRRIVGAWMALAGLALFSASGEFLAQTPQVLCEALLVGVAAGLAGYLAGHGLALKVLALLHMADVAPPPFSLAALALTTGGIAAVSVLAAAFPAWKASRVEPAAALVSL